MSGNGTINVSTAITASTGDYFRLDGSGGTYTAVVDTVAGNGLSFTVVRAEGSVSSPYTLASFEEPTKIHNIGSSDMQQSINLGRQYCLVLRLTFTRWILMYHQKIITTNLTSSGLTRLHNMFASDISGAVGEFHQLNVDHVNARIINSMTDTVEHIEINVKQLIPAVSQSAGAAQEGAGLQIGGTAGSGSAGIASIVLGDAGSGAGADLLFKVGSTQGASLSGSISDGGQRFGITGSLSASIGVFHEITVNQDMGAQDSIFSGSSFTGHLLSGSTAEAHFLNADETQVADVSGSSMTYNSVTGSEINAHRLQVDKSNVTVRIGGAEGTTLTYVTLSGNLAQAHLFDADIATINDLHVTGAAGGLGVTSGSISGSAESFFHKLPHFLFLRLTTEQTKGKLRYMS